MPTQIRKPVFLAESHTWAGLRESMRNAIVSKASNILIQDNEVFRPVEIFADLSGKCQIPGSGQYVVYGPMHYDYVNQKLIGNRTHGIQVFLHEDTSPTNCEDPKGSMTVGRYTVRDNHIMGQTDKEVRLVWEGPVPAAGPNLVTNNYFSGTIQATGVVGPNSSADEEGSARRTP